MLFALSRIWPGAHGAGAPVSHYRAHPEVLPSLRALLSPAAREGALLSCEATDADVDRAVSDGREDEARRRAAAAPCPAFATPPPRGVTVSGYPVLRLPPLSLTVQPGEDWRDVLASSLAPGRPVFG